ncbi:MAG TPA: LCP family protein [Egibacteraceae bacterium]|nr:LCP family protein [Egibacteraceae bacterium]
MDDFGPALQGGRIGLRRSLWVRAGLVFAAVVAAGAMFVGGVGAALVMKGEASIERVQVEGLSQPGDTNDDGVVDTEEITDVLNILLVGSDSRAGLTEERLAQIGTNDDGGYLTDTIMLLQLDPKRDRAALLSFPRDLRVTLCNGGTAKINAAYATGRATDAGGPSCLVQTVEDLTDIQINHYIEIGFEGFINVIDQLGGVSLYLEEPIKESKANINLPAGCNQLDGLQALAFARVRNIDNDFGRIARQQRLIREVLDELTSVDTLINVPRLLNVVESVGGAVQADEALSLSRMKRIAFSLRNITSQGLETRTVPGYTKTIDGQSFVIAEEDRAEALFQAFRDGSIFPEDVGTGQARSLRPSDVPPVEILNGVGTQGLAGQAAQILEEAGFESGATGNAETFDVATTKILHAPHEQTEAELLAKALGGAELELGDAATTLTVVVGADFEFDTLRATATPTSPPAASPDAQKPEPEPEPTPEFRGASPSDVQC